MAVFAFSPLCFLCGHCVLRAFALKRAVSENLRSPRNFFRLALQRPQRRISPKETSRRFSDLRIFAEMLAALRAAMLLQILKSIVPRRCGTFTRRPLLIHPQVDQVARRGDGSLDSVAVGRDAKRGHMGIIESREILGQIAEAPRS